jgi:hypothetical protein
MQHGDTVGGDKVGGDKVGGDKTGRDKITVGPDASIGGAAPVKRKRGSAIVTYVSLAIAAVVLVAFVVLGITGTLEWKYALPAALGGSLVIAGGGLLASHLRG